MTHMGSSHVVLHVNFTSSHPSSLTSALLGLACGRVVSAHAVQLAEGGAGNVEGHPSQDGQKEARQQQRAAVSQLRQLL